MSEVVKTEVSLSKETEKTILSIVELVQANADVTRELTKQAQIHADRASKQSRFQTWMIGIMMAVATVISGIISAGPVLYSILYLS